MSSHEEVLSVAKDYLTSIFYGDVEKLRSTFHPRAILGGVVKGSPYYKSVDEYLEVVKKRKAPNELNEIYKMSVISVEVIGEIAFVKTHCPMLGYNYFDYLSFVVFEGRWVIVSKVFTHVD